MKIAMATNVLLPADQEGGTAHSNFYLATALRAAGAEVSVVTTDRNGAGRLDVPRDTWTEREGIHVFYASTSRDTWIRSPAYARAVGNAVAQCDVCIMSGVFWNFTGLAAARACRRHGVPYITMPRGLLGSRALAHKGLKKRLYWSLLAKRLVEGSSAVIALAQQELADIRAAGIGVPGHIVPNGAFVEGAEGTGCDATQERSARGGRYVLFLGRLHRTKGLDILLPAFDAVARTDKDLQLVIAGSANRDFAKELDSLLSRMEARERVRLVGNVTGTAKAQLIADAEVFALTSHGEGLPVAVLEALSAGVPVVVTRQCNLPEVTSSDAGIEVDADVNSAARALREIVSNRTLRARMAANARALARGTFSWQRVGERVLLICRSVARDPEQSTSCSS